MQRRKFLQLSAGGLGSVALSRLGTLTTAFASAPTAPRHVPVIFDRQLPVHPLLQYGARAEPDKVVRVIVQKANLGPDLDLIVRLLGVGLLEDLHFINSQVMELPQRKTLELGRQPGVLYVSPDGRVQRHSLSATMLTTRYPVETNAAAIWAASGDTADGHGMTVAVIDSGAAPHSDLPDLVRVNAHPLAKSTNDTHGHGTHIAGIIAGKDPSGRYLGIAPRTRIVSVKVSDDRDVMTASDLLRGMQWVFDHRLIYNIRVVNLSVTAGNAESYKTSPLAVGAERLWRSGIVVVVAAGNQGSARDATYFSPANDPYVITVGALDDNLTLNPNDDRLADFSSRGTTQDGIIKPDLVAPGRQIVSTLASHSCTLAKAFPTRITDGQYLRLSGTSMAAPMVAGIVSLLLERYPSLTPNQVKGVLLDSAGSYSTMPDSARMVNALSAIRRAKSGAIRVANQGLSPAIGLAENVRSLRDNDHGNNAYWDNAYWDNAYWDNAYWDVSPGDD